MTVKLPFFFDYISPYAHLAWAQTPAFAASHDVVFEPCPILFAALLDRWGHKGPAEIPPKRLFTFRDVVRRAHRLGVPIAMPRSHPFNPLLALRATLAAPAELRPQVTSALFRTIWSERGDPADEATLVASLAQVDPRQAPEWLRQATQPQVKAALHDATDRALEAGVFGVPSIVVQGQVLWGQDQFPALQSILRGDDPAAALTDAVLDGLAASARRRVRTDAGGAG